MAPGASKTGTKLVFEPKHFHFLHHQTQLASTRVRRLTSPNARWLLQDAARLVVCCTVFKKQSRFFFPMRCFQSTYCGFTPLATMCNNTDGALTELFCLANFTKQTCSAEETHFTFCPLCVWGGGSAITFL